MLKHPQDDTDYRRIFVAIFLAAIVLVSWQALVEWPRRQHLAEFAKKELVVKAQEKQEYQKAIVTKEGASAEENPNLTREERLALSPRVKIASAKLDGSIALRGARFDDLHLAKYRTELDPASPEVTLFSPNGDDLAYFAQIGWVSADGKTVVPDHHSLWQADKSTLSANDTVKLSWNNGEGVTYFLNISLDDHYMFAVSQRVENKSGHAISLSSYAFLNRAHDVAKKDDMVAHAGPLAVADKTLTEVPYADLHDKGNKVFEGATGWFGFTDKYWLGAVIPNESGYKNTFSHYMKGASNRYQADYMGKAQTIESGSSMDSSLRLFAGAKEIHVLDRYTDGMAGENNPPIPLFDRAVDFGMLYFLTKPMFLTLTFFYAHIGNMGIAIMLLTIVVKLLMFPLANKSYHSMAQMRAIQPEMQRLRGRYADDQIALNKAMMELYKKEKINPASGCLPLFIQLPVFFALYKVLYVTIEMRHAPFFGWLRDLSAPDPSNIFTLFSLVPWTTPSWLHLGILPILFCATMVIQMKQQPAPPDPVQAKVMSFMPYMFLFLFAGFASGLVLYWLWSNLLSIVQQQVISKGHKRKQAKKSGGVVK